MILDRSELFSNAQAITADAASTNVLDTGAPGTVYAASSALLRDLGKGNGVPITIAVVEAFNSLTSLNIAYQVSVDAAFTSPVTITSSTYTLAQLNANDTYFEPARVPGGSNLRYHRLYYDVTGTNPSTGKITAGYSMGVQSNTIL